MVPTDDFALPACTVAYNGPSTRADRWTRFKPRFGDILLCSPHRCDTQWVQAICGRLTAGGRGGQFAPHPSARLDADFPESDAEIDGFEEKIGRRIFTTHTPLDGVPYYPECAYVAIYCDPRDAFFQSNQSNGVIPAQAGTQSSGENLDSRPRGNDKRELNAWFNEPFRVGAAEQATLAAFAHHLAGFWRFRHLPNIHLFHLADLVRNFQDGIRAIAAAIAQQADETAIDEIVRATPYRNTQPQHTVLGEADAARYRARLLELLPQDAAEWVENDAASVIHSKPTDVIPAQTGTQSAPRTLDSRSFGNDNVALKEVEAAAAKRELPRAIELARKHLGDGLEHPLFLNLRAYWHENAGRDMHALVDLNRARLFAPQSPIILNSLGLAYARQHRPTDALDSFSKAVAADPSFAPAQFNKGWASEEVGEIESAKGAFEKAAALQPLSAAPWARLAALAVRVSDWAFAREAAEKALAIESLQPVATVALANVEIAEAESPSAEVRIRGLLSRQIATADRAYALTALGDALDTQHRFSEAFAAYAERNALLHALHAPRFSGTQAQTMPQQVKWLCEYLESVAPNRRLPASIESLHSAAARRHVFVLGFARSGTTLLEEILAAHPLVSSTQEREAMADSVRAFMVSPTTMAKLESLPELILNPYREAYWRGIHGFGIDPAGRYVIDKQPFNTIRLPLIARLFPSADVLYCLRDPRDVVLSCFRRQFHITPATFELLTLEGAARFYDGTMKIGALSQTKLPLNRLDVRHEDLLHDFEAEMRRVCAFIALPWDDAMRRFYDRTGKRPITTPSATQIAKGLDSTSRAHWRNYRDQLAPVLDILKPWVAHFGYQLE
jgi:tetratricopeptide (TPR) repeat protein